jgi:beta-galactosidase
MSRINLNFDWRYMADYKKDYLSSEYNDDKFERVNIPHTNKLVGYNNFDEGEYQFVSCYRKMIYMPEAYIGKSLILNFGGVASHAGIYLNGRFLGEHFGGYTPFEIDISDKVDFGKNNLLAVCCDSTERPDIPPFGNVIDYLAYGGIYREVWLEVKDKRYIRDIFIKTFNLQQASKTLEIDVEMSCALPGYEVQFQITDIRGSVISQFSYFPGRNLKFNIRGRVTNVQLWDLNNPVLYTMRVQLREGNSIIDEQTRRFGFREISFRPDGFYLNGQKYKLIGLNRHQSYPYVGYAMPESAQKKDAEILKYELGVDVVRTSHYPQSPHFLNRCDEIGLLVFEEIPGWQHIGEGKWIEVACMNVREMILRDRNHPCIIMWGVRINESPDCNALYSETNKIAHELDNTRPTGGVRNFADSNLLEDVYTYNDFIHMGSNPALKLPEKVVKGNVPYLVTEHNGHMYPTKRFDNEDRRIEHALRHMRVIDSMMGSQRISGCIGWCAFDYNTHKDFGSGDRICYHGVGDMFRIPKAAWYVYAS